MTERSTGSAGAARAGALATSLPERGPKGTARGTAVVSAKGRKVRYSLWRTIVRERWAYLLLLPGLCFFIAFYYLPLLGNVIAFQDFSPYLGFFRSPWVGLENFVQIFQAPEIGIVVANTLIISVLQIIFAFPAGIVLSLMLNALISERFKRFMQSIVYLPHFLGWVIIISIWQLSIYSAWPRRTGQCVWYLL